MQKIVEVFLASPGDMDRERAIVRDCVSTFNDQWGTETFGLMFHVIGWESVPAVAQRPQARINEDANKSDLFIGLLGRRWGTDTGEYSSGFFEEFQAAKRRRQETGRPEVSVFFKTPDRAMLEDIGPQLSQVRKFRQELIDAREVLFHDFGTDEELRKHIGAVLAEYCKKSKAAAQQDRETDQTRNREESVRTGERQSIVATGDSIQPLLKLAAAQEAAGSSDPLDFWGALRLHLYALSTYAELRPDVVLTTHEANLVYRRRHSWDLVDRERNALVNTMCADSHGYAPGWFWLADSDPVVMRSRLDYLLVAEGAGRETAARIVSHGDELPSPGALALSLDDASTFRPILQLLARIGRTEHLVLLERPDKLDKLENYAFAQAQFSILQRSHGELPIELVLKYADEYVEDAARVLTDRIRSMGKLAQEALLSTVSGEQARLAVIRSLAKVDALDEAQARRLLDDPDTRVREIAVLALSKLGRSFTRPELDTLFPRGSGGTLMSLRDWVDKERLFGAGLHWRSYEEVRPLLDFFDGLEVHKALLADHFGKYLDDLERQIETDFETLLQESEAKSKSQGFSRIAIWSKTDNSLIESKRRRFIETSLEAAASVAASKALSWAHRYADAKYHPDLRSVALAILGRSNEPLELDFLRIDIKDLSADAVAVLLPIFLERHQIDTRLIESAANNKDDSARQIAIRLVSTKVNEASAKVLESALLSPEEKVRTFAAVALWAGLDRSRLEVILTRYIELPTYYYDVTAILDAAVYAPAPYNERLRESAISGKRRTS